MALPDIIAIRFSGHRKKIWIRARHTNEVESMAQRQNRIAIPRQSFSCPNTYFQLSFVFVQLRVVFGGRNSVTFRWDTCFRPICRTVLPDLVRIIRALSSKQIFHPKLIPFDNFVSFFGVVHLSACRGKNQVAFFSYFAIVFLVVRAPTLLPTCLCSPSQRMLAAVLCALMVVRSILANIAFTCFCSKHAKTSRSASTLLQRAKRLRIIFEFSILFGVFHP